MHRKFGFTLAEVLITLGIIGVVAALTIPTLISKADEQASKSALKKNYSIINQAFQSLLQDNDGNIKGVYNGWSDEFLMAYKDKFAKSKYCPNPAQGTCWHNNGVAKTLNGVDDWVTTWGGVGGLMLNDGTLMAVNYFSKDCTDGDGCGILIVDVNGFKKPNIQGKDIFSFEIRETKLIPYGAPGTYVESNVEHACSKTDSSEGQGGLGCTYDIIMGNSY